MPALLVGGKPLLVGGKRLLAGAGRPPVGGAAGSTISGASGNAARDGTFATYRGTPVAIIGTWNDGPADTQLNQWTVNPRYYNDSFSVLPAGAGMHLDVGVGLIVAGESLANAAAGAYDSRWTTSIGYLADALKPTAGPWAGFPGRPNAHLYARVAHEFNLSGTYPWEVTVGNEATFVAALRRYYGLFHQIMTDRGVRDRAHLVWCPNDDSNNGVDIRNCHPGADYMDVNSVDAYNKEFYWVATTAEWNTQILRTQNGGSPFGIERHRLFAESLGLPFSLGEWGNRMTAAGPTYPTANGDGRVWLQEMRAWQTLHKGNGAGKLLYEVYFNVEGFGGGVYRLFPDPLHQPTADKYAELW